MPPPSPPSPVTAIRTLPISGFQDVCLAQKALFVLPRLALQFMVLFRGNHADATLRVDRRLKGIGSPRCFWVYPLIRPFPHQTLTVDLLLVDSSKPAAQRSTSHRAKLPPATLLAPPSMLCPTYVQALEPFQYLPTAQRLQMWKLW